MKVYDLVKLILTEEPQTRDSDKILLWMIWGIETLSSRVNAGEVLNRVFVELQESDFMQLCSTPETITRARRLVQHNFPKLRSSKQVQKEKDKKEKTKGTFAYREESNIVSKEPLSKKDLERAFPEEVGKILDQAFNKHHLKSVNIPNRLYKTNKRSKK